MKTLITLSRFFLVLGVAWVVNGFQSNLTQDDEDMLFNLKKASADVPASDCFVSDTSSCVSDTADCACADSSCGTDSSCSGCSGDSGCGDCGDCGAGGGEG